jgi:hypothetical protein
LSFKRIYDHYRQKNQQASDYQQEVEDYCQNKHGLDVGFVRLLRHLLPVDIEVVL